MSHHELFLLFAALIVILGVVVAIARFRVHPFPALVIGALALGLWSGASPDQVLMSFRKGFGETEAGVGVLLALGAMFGELLASSGGAERLSSSLLKIGGPLRTPLVGAMTWGAVLLRGRTMTQDFALPRPPRSLTHPACRDLVLQPQFAAVFYAFVYYKQNPTEPFSTRFG